MNSKITKILSLVMLVALFCMIAGCAPAEGTAQEGGTGGIIMMVAYMAVIFGMLYFFMVRPEKKRKKKLDEMRDSLSVGDQVTTIGGIVGKIVHVKDEFIVIETSEDRVRIELAKWAVGANGKAATQDQ